MHHGIADHPLVHPLFPSLDSHTLSPRPRARRGQRIRMLPVDRAEKEGGREGRQQSRMWLKGSGYLDLSASAGRFPPAHATEEAPVTNARASGWWDEAFWEQGQLPAPSNHPVETRWRLAALLVALNSDGDAARFGDFRRLHQRVAH